MFLDALKDQISKEFSLTTTQWVFFSVFSKNTLILSKGVFQTDKTLDETIDSFFYGFMQKDLDSLDHVVVDVVDQVHELTQAQDIVSTNMQTHWLIVIGANDIVGVVLPATVGIVDAKHALSTVKQKNSTSGNAWIYKFTTKRLIVNK